MNVTRKIAAMSTEDKIALVETVIQQLEHKVSAGSYNMWICHMVGTTLEGSFNSVTTKNLRQLGILADDNHDHKNFKTDYAWYSGWEYEERFGHLYMALFRLMGYIK